MAPGRSRRCSAGTGACALLAAVAFGAGIATAAEPDAGGRLIHWTEARDHIGERVVVEGRIVATHASPLSILLSFDESFNTFTAVIRPANLEAFPQDPAEYYRGKKVRVRGRIEEYEKKAEIVVRNPRQIEIVKPEADLAEPNQPEAKDDESRDISLAILSRLADIQARLDDIADRLELIADAIDREPARPQAPPANVEPGSGPGPEAASRPRYQQLRRLKRGMKAADVERLMGPPYRIEPQSRGGEIWDYGSGRSVVFNPRGRIEAMSGFSGR